MSIHPILVGIVNALVPGLGYLVIKERLALGGGMFAAAVLFMLAMLVDPSPALGTTLLLAVTPVGQILEGCAYALAVVAFGYDAYDLAKKKRAATTAFSTT